MERVHEATKIDPWFLDEIELINEIAGQLREAPQHRLEVERKREAGEFVVVGRGPNNSSAARWLRASSRSVSPDCVRMPGLSD